MPPILNINGNILVDTVANWTADATVYSAKKILVSSDATYTGTDQRKWKLANGVDTWANLDYMPIGYGTLAQILNAGNKTGGQYITSDDGMTALLIDDSAFYFSRDDGAGNNSGGIFDTTKARLFANFLSGNYGEFKIDDSWMRLIHSLLIELNAPNVNLPNETASRILTTDASKNIDSALSLTTSTSLAGNSDANIPSEKAVKAYVDSSVVGLMDYRGVYDASVNAYPSSGGSGTAGAILKSDFWIVSVAGTLPTGLVVGAGDLVIAKQDTPGNTQSNWEIVEYNIGYTPENAANKSDSYTVSSSTTYGSTKALVDGLGTKQALLSLAANEFYARSSSGAAANKTITDFGLSLVDDADAKTSRVTIGQDKRTTNGDSNYSILATDKEVVTSAPFTAARDWTLPDASTVNEGYEIIVADEIQGITSSNTLTIKVQTGQKLNDTTNGTEVMQSAGAHRRLFSNGTNGWIFDAGITRASNTQTLINKTMSGSSNTFSNIPSYAITGYEGYSMQCGIASFNPLDSTTYYFGSSNSVAANTTDTAFSLMIPKSGTIKSIVIDLYNAGTLGSGTASTWSVRINSTNTTISSAVTTNATVQHFSNNSMSVVVSAGDLLQIVFDSPAYPTNPTAIRGNITVYIE